MVQKLGRIPTFNHIIEEYKCDKCGRAEKGIGDSCFEYQEFTTISISGGFGSVFGDGAEIECDLCQHCLKELIGEYMHWKSIEQGEPFTVSGEEL